MKKHQHKSHKHTHLIRRHKTKLSKRRYPKPVYLQKEESLELKPTFFDSEFRWIEDLRNVHKGEEIWVLGCGPSLDDFPDNFFDRKYRIAIACKWSVIGFPNCAYSAFSRCDQGLTNHVLANRSHFLSSHIVHLRGSGKGGRFIGQEPIYMKVFTKLQGEDYYQSLPKYLLNEIPIRYGATGTLIHWDIQAAIIMGAKKVTLVGCEASVRKFQRHALKRGMDWAYGPTTHVPGIKGVEHFRRRETPPLEGYPEEWQKGESKMYQRLRIGVFWLAKHFAPHGIQIARYYYKKGYEKII